MQGLSRQVLQMVLRDIFEPFSTNVVLKVAYVALCNLLRHSKISLAGNQILVSS